MSFFNKLLLASSIGLASIHAHANNVILIIGDGMDDQQISIARNYLVGAEGKLVLDTMPVRGAVKVITIDENDPSKIVYVADSANSASSMATGVVTSIGRISSTAKTNQHPATIMALASARGIATGVVTTASVTDATPAAFLSHSLHRGCESPQTMDPNFTYYGAYKIGCDADRRDRGGVGSIAEQLSESPVDVVLGGGMKHFDQISDSDGKHLLTKARDNGFTIITTPEELPVRQPGKLMGLFSPSTMPVIWRGTNSAKAEKVTDKMQAFSCEPNPKYTGVPSLKAMTETALSKLENNANGFMLMVESASIDKESHSRNPCGHIGELKQLNETVALALDFAATHKDTLVLVTADHGHAAQIVPADSVFTRLENYLGRIALINTPEGSTMAVSYATAEKGSEQHSGVNVPIFGNETAAGLVAANIKQNDIFTIMKNYLGL